LSSPKKLRKERQRALDWVAVHAGVSTPLVRLYEIDPSHVTEPHKRARLAAVYEELARDGGASLQAALEGEIPTEKSNSRK